MPSDDELLERTLAFSGSYVSDDGNVSIRRVVAESLPYSACALPRQLHRLFLAASSPPTGEPICPTSARRSSSSPRTPTATRTHPERRARTVSARTP